jgi:glutamate-1-semialdehyde 2,1-aminomutase
MTTNQQAFDRAKAVMPGGVNSPVRAFGSVGGVPRSFVSGKGPYVTDVEGTEYVDLVGAWGPALLGHAHPAVVDAVRSAAGLGFGFGASNPAEAELAELIRDRVGRKLIGRVRLVSTGTEATMTAIRLARGATGRNLLVKFAGHYHGHSDGLLAEAGSGMATLAIPGSAGVPEAVAAQTIVIAYNDLIAVRAAFAERGSQIAAVIVEGAAANMGVVAPDPGFNAALAAIAHKHGALLIVDEVLTGFRVGPAGWLGLETEPYDADLITYGKVIGGGLPLAALAGRAELMDQLAPVGPVYQAGTLSGNPLALAAGIATLTAADSSVYSRLDAAATAIADATSAALSAAGVEHSVQRAGNLFSVAFRSGAPRSYLEAKDQQAFRYPPFFHAMLDAGVSLPPSVFEAWFVSSAHDDVAVNRILDALPAASKAASAAS